MTAKRRYDKASSRIAKRQKFRRYASLFLKISLPVIFLAGLVFVLRADFLQIKDFTVLGTETLSSKNIKDIASNFISGNDFFVIPRSDILFLNKNELSAVLLSNFPRLEKIEINKQFFSKQIELKVTERKTDFLWCSEQDICFSMNKDGLVFESYSAPDLRDLIIFRGVLIGDPLMKNFATSEQMKNYLNFIEIFKSANFDISDINIESDDKAVARTKIGDVIFNPADKDLSMVAQNVILLINEVRGKNPSVFFQYIDARFDNKIFYKL